MPVRDVRDGHKPEGAPFLLVASRRQSDFFPPNHPGSLPLKEVKKDVNVMCKRSVTEGDADAHLSPLSPPKCTRGRPKPLARFAPVRL